MPQDTSRRDDILNAALHVFAEKGVHKASIKEIAKQAQLNAPSLIYWYFKDKRELVQAVVAELSPVVRTAADPEALMDEPPETVLPEIMRAYYATLDHPDGPRLIKLLFSEAVRNPELAAQYSEGQRQVMRFVSSYLEHQVELGRLRPQNVQASARAFLGAMFAYVLTREILPYYGEDLPDREAYIAEVVDTFLNGLKLEPS